MKLRPRPSKTKGCGWGVWIVVLLVVAFVGGILYVTTFSNVAARWMGQETFPFKADTHRLDPFAALGEVRQRVGANAHLTYIEAEFVRSDGTMDLDATYTPGPHITYKFQIPLDKPPADAPPVGAGRGPGDVWIQEVRVECYQPGQTRSVTKSSGSGRTSYRYTNEGMSLDRRTPHMAKLESDLGSPKVSPADLWKIALERGAPRDAVATIEFNKTGYSFGIRATTVAFDCDLDGKPKT